MGLYALFRKARPVQAVPEPSRSPGAAAAGSSGWVRAGMRFDVHCMSRDQLREMAHQLLAGGAISMPDLRLLTLEPLTCSPDWPNWNTFETPGGVDARRDWMQEIAARIRRGHPDYAYIGYLQLLRSFLERVEAARPPLAQPVDPDVAATWPSRPAPVRPAPGRLTSPLPRPAST